MTNTKITEDLKKMNEKLRLEGIDMTKEDHIKVVEDTSKELMNILGDNDKYADIKDHEADLKETLKLLEERKENLKIKNSVRDIEKADIENGYTDIMHTDDVTKATAADKLKANKIGGKIELLYKEFAASNLIKNLPTTDFTTNDLYTELRVKDSTKGTEYTGIQDIEELALAKNPIALTDIQKIVTQLKKAGQKFKISSTVPNDMKEDVTKILILFTQLHLLYHGDILGSKCPVKPGKGWNMIVEKAGCKKLEEYYEILRKGMAALNGYMTTDKTIGFLDKRVKNLDKLNRTDIEIITGPNINIDTKTIRTTIIKDSFIDNTKVPPLDEEPTGYELGTITIKDATGNDLKDKSGKVIQIFEDIDGKKPFTRVLKQGEEADIYITDGAKTKKLGKIKLDNTSGPTRIEFELESYQDIPTEVVFPNRLEIQATGIGKGKWKSKDNKVGTTKTLAIELLKPDFGPMYNTLNAGGMFDNRLEYLYNMTYETIIESELNKFFEKSTNPSISNARKQLSYEEKKTFFNDVVMNNAHPIRGAMIANIDKVWESNIYNRADFKTHFRDKILKDFTGRTIADLTGFVIEKIGTEPYSLENPTYAQGIISEKAENTYKGKDETTALELSLHMFSLGLGTGTITPLDMAALHPTLTDLHGNKEINAVVADVEAVSEERAMDEANKEFTQEYMDSTKRSLKRAKMFFGRSHIINKKIKEKMKGTSKELITDEETTSAVNRWMIKKNLKLAGANKITEATTVFNDPVFQAELNRLTNEYLSVGTVKTDDTYEKEVTDLINNNSELKTYMGKNKVSQIGSNLIERVKYEKTQRKYYEDIIKITDDYLAKATIKTRNEYDEKIRAKISEFSEQQKKLPDLVKELKLDINATDFSEKLMKHKNTLEKMRQRTVTMRLNMLTNKNKADKGLTTAQNVNIEKLGGRGKLYKFMEKHPLWAALGTTGALVGTVVGTGLLGVPIIGTGLGAGILFTLNYLKKRGHYTKEHVKFEKELLAMNEKDRDTYLKDMELEAEKRPDRLRKVFPTRYDKYGKSMEYLGKTKVIDKHISDIESYIKKPGILSAGEKDALREYVIQAIAAFKLQEKEGRNFGTTEKGKEHIEKLYNDLYNAIIGGIQRYNPTVDPIATYTLISGSVTSRANTILRNTDYNKDKAEMASMRNKLGIYAGSKAAAIYLGTAWLTGQLGEAWNKTVGTTNTTSTTINTLDINPAIKNTIQSDLGRTIDFNNLNNADKLDLLRRFTNHGYRIDPATNEIFKNIITSGGGTQLDPAFGPNGQDLLNKVFDGDTTKFELFKAKIQSIPPGDRSATLRDTMKDIYGTKGLATSKTHVFFDNFGKTIMENGNSELIKLTTQSPLSNGGANAIAAKMSSRYTNSGILSPSEFSTVTNPTQIKSLFDGFASGTYNLNNLPTGWSVETANNILHCKYAGFGDGLKEYIFDQGTAGTAKDIIGSIGSDTITTGGGTTGWNRGHFASGGVPTVWNEVNNFTEKK